MSLVVTQVDRVEEPSGFPSTLVLTWVIIAALSFFLGVLFEKCCRRKPQVVVQLPVARWERLVRKASYFVAKRRRISLAFGNYKEHTLRNSEGSKPTTARRAIKQRAHTPNPSRVLHEGPAIVR